ncbi:MAG: response regulator, partial [Pirellulales bacterium]
RMTPYLTVLLVDDDHDVVRGVSLRLRAAGYETLAAYDGEQGVAAAKEARPDAIVLDVRMPGLDGLAALGQLRNCRDTQQIPVVMVSASLVDQHAALDSGARFFLSKPYQPKTLLAAIEAAMSTA